MRINGSNSGVPPTNPYHISRAYGVRATGGAPAAAAAVGEVDRAGVRRLVGGVVPGGVEFGDGSAVRPSSGALPMYRHPADKNAAATAVSVGRKLDVSA